MNICSIQERFATPVPSANPTRSGEVAFELKPYLQPFERELAFRELRAMLAPGDVLREVQGYWLATTNVSETSLRAKLTYWQRVGQDVLKPTLQKALEFTQVGGLASFERLQLHRARRLRYGPHDLHEYRGKFFPQLVRSLINISGVSDRSLVLDPMCGSGTTPCEAVAAGMEAIGADLNPLSVLISSLKAAIPATRAEDFRRGVGDRIAKFKFGAVDPLSIWGPEDLSYLDRWFDPRAIADLSSIIGEVRKIRVPVHRDFFRVCVSNIVRSISWQKAADLRVRKEVLPYEAGEAHARFLEVAHEQFHRIYPYLKVLNGARRGGADVRHGNAVDVRSIFPEYEGCVDLLVTSPPYATALPYLDTDRLSLIALGLLQRKDHGKAEREMVGTREVSERERRESWHHYEARSAELPTELVTLIGYIAHHNHAEGVGFRRRNLPALLGKYFLSMLDAMRSAHKMMKPGAFAYYVVGNNSTEVAGEKMEIPTDDLLFKLAAKAGWHPVEKISMELIASRDIFRDNRGSAETILCLRA